MDYRLLALVAMVLWGVQAVAIKVLGRLSDWRSFIVTYGLVLTAVGLLLTGKGWSVSKILPALVVGIIGALGFTFYVLAINDGNPAIVQAITGFSIFVALVLSAGILKEPVSTKEVVGMLLAILSILLLTLP